eukprot:6872703-Pyramimonas_sp.AAC.1
MPPCIPTCIPPCMPPCMGGMPPCMPPCMPPPLLNPTSGGNVSVQRETATNQRLALNVGFAVHSTPQGSTSAMRALGLLAANRCLGVPKV